MEAQLDVNIILHCQINLKHLPILSYFFFTLCNEVSTVHVLAELW